MLKIWLTMSLAKRHKTETPLTDATEKRGLPVFVLQEYKPLSYMENLSAKACLVIETRYKDSCRKMRG